MHGQLGMKCIYQGHGVNAMHTTEVDHTTHNQHTIVHGGVRAMSTHYDMNDSIGTMEMVP